VRDVLTLRVGPDSAPVPDIGQGDRRDQNVWLDVHGQTCVWAESRNGARWMYIPRVGSYSFSPERDEVYVVPDPSASPALVRSGYLRTVLPMAVQALGHEVLHASAVLTARGVVAFCAVSTTGKTTLAAALNRRRYPLWADDALAVEPGSHTVDALALPFETDQYRVEGSTDAGRPPTERAPLVAVCVLERRPTGNAHGSATISRLGPSEAFLALVTHAYCFSLEDVERNRGMMDQYLEVVRSVPVYRVIYQSGLDELPATLDLIEREVGMSAPELT
jgi:hypothetical protein